MNTHTLESHSDSTTTHAPHVAHSATSAVHRTAHPPSPLDRFALRIGVALIIWGRRSYRPGASRSELIRRHVNRVALQQREREDQRRHALAVVDR